MTEVLAEIINPSDAYTIRGTRAAICVVALFLGRGKYALRDEQGEDVGLPLFMFGGDPKEWFEAEFGQSFDQYLDSHVSDLKAALASVVIGSFAERRIFDKAMEAIDDGKKRREFADQWHDQKRSSMNDIGGQARKWSDELERSETVQAS